MCSFDLAGQECPVSCVNVDMGTQKERGCWAALFVFEWFAMRTGRSACVTSLFTRRACVGERLRLPGRCSGG